MLHVDGRHFEGDNTPATSNTWLLRRVRPIVEGTFGNIYDFRFTPGFGGGRFSYNISYTSGVNDEPGNRGPQGTGSWRWLELVP